MKSKHKSFGRADEGLVTCRVYEDGDVVVCHGARGNVENIAHSEGAPGASSRSEDGRNDNRSNCEVVEMADVSGHGPLLNMSDRLDLPFEYEQAVINFVNDSTDVFN